MKELTFRNLLNNHNVPDSQKAFGYLGKEYLTYGAVKEEIKKIKSNLVQAVIG